MVLQRDRPIHLWGWAEPGEKVTATLNGATQSAIGDRVGTWNIYLPPQAAGGPFQLTVSGTNIITVDDILIGDVWFASGQSNMEMPLTGFPGAVVKNSAEEISRADQPTLRLLMVKKKPSSYPLRDFEPDVEWTVCKPATAARFSAVAYFFGREIAAKEHVPVGLIDSTWGGTPAEAWVSLDTISAHTDLMPVFATWAPMANEQADIPAMLAAERREDAEAKRAGLPLPKHSWHPDRATYAPAWLYNGMVAPAINFGIKGVIWYQGETNSKLARAPLYQTLFPALIADWRSHWREGNFPFFYVQISSFKSDATESWSTVREAQRRTLSVSDTGMAVTIDIGDPDNVHPADKQTVAARLVLAARALAYGENIEYSGPIFRQTSVEAAGVRVWFDHAGSTLVANGVPEGLEVAGEDNHFMKASATIDGPTVVVSSSEVKEPKYARYGWANAPTVNLFNAAGLPASPFTSEEEIPVPLP